jgi:hypothetical protein
MKKLMLAVCVLALSAMGASADVLWDQSNWDTSGDGMVNMAYTTCSFINGNTKMHEANDVTFTTNVLVSSITIYETEGNGNAASASQGYLWITPKTGSLPTASSADVNNAANLVSITSAYVEKDGVFGLAITASGLNLALPAGDYWVSLTPRCSAGMFPWSVLCFSSGGIVGDSTKYIEACSVNSNWGDLFAPDQHDGAIKIEGTATVPTESEAWGNIKALYR